MPTKKNARCKSCNYVIKRVSKGNGWGHKKKEHWLDRPHKAVPVDWEALPALADSTA